ncbi:MAG: tetratricopeptide repeat protein [Terracidiphilus sp.]|jgi:tetratricopeptide (TPR) repeat protein
MTFRAFSTSAAISIAVICLLVDIPVCVARAQSSGAGSDNSSKAAESSSSGQAFVREKAPTLIDAAGPTISLISAEPVFLMAAALNACGYDDGMDESAPVRKRVRDEMNQALEKSEDARAKRDRLCLYVAQHRMTGSDRDIAQYISLALYLTPPPALETAVELTEMPPDSTQVIEIVPLLREFAAAVDLHGIWLGVHHIYDAEADKIHDPLSQMIVNTNFYLKLPASTYDGRRFVVVIEPMLSPRMVNARVYGTDYVVVVSPVNGTIPMTGVRHTYLHYVIEPLLYSREKALDRTQPILKEVRDAPMEFRFRADSVALTIECLIKAIEARTLDTGIPEYRIPANADRSEMPRYEHERAVYQQKVDAMRMAAMNHDMTQGYVMTQYFYNQLIQFEKDPASLRDTIGEMVYSMDVEAEAHQARQIEFDKVADDDVLTRSKPRKLTGLDLAEAKLAAGEVASASLMARQALAVKSDTLESIAESSRAEFILARAAILQGQPEQAIDGFQRTLATSKDPRLLSWSHIYLGRMLDLDCKRDEAVAEYREALKTRDGQQDTRLAAERGLKTAYAIRGHSCEDDSAESVPGDATEKPQGHKPDNGTEKP